MFVIMTVFLIASVPVSAWEASGSLTQSPVTIYPGTQATFSWTVENAGSEPMQISDIWMGFDWQAGGQGYMTDDVPVTIDAGDSHTFTFPVTIPDGIPSNTEHEVIIQTVAADPDGVGGWGTPTDKEVTKYIYVTTASDPSPTPDPTPDPVDDTTDDTSDDAGGEETPGFTFPIIVSAVFISVGIFGIVKRRM